MPTPVYRAVIWRAMPVLWDDAVSHWVNRWTLALGCSLRENEGRYSLLAWWSRLASNVFVTASPRAGWGGQFTKNCGATGACSLRTSHQNDGCSLRTNGSLRTSKILCSPQGKPFEKESKYFPINFGHSIIQVWSHKMQPFNLEIHLLNEFTIMLYKKV